MTRAEFAAEFTATERRILKVLADGFRHNWREFVPCLNDSEGASKSTVRKHISNISKKLAPKGEDILCETDGRRNYWRHVRILASPYNE